jgi:hypothetical protein
MLPFRELKARMAIGTPHRSPGTPHRSPRKPHRSPGTQHRSPSAISSVVTRPNEGHGLFILEASIYDVILIY